MSTALATIPPQQLVPVEHYTLGEKYQLAKSIARSGIWGFRDENAVMAAFLLAEADNQPLGSVLRDYDNIKNKLVKRAEAMLRDFQRSGGKVFWHRYEDAGAKATFSHPQGGEITIDWDENRARQAGLINKDNYVKFPRPMWRSRCISEGVRTIYPAATGGFQAPEDIDFGHDEGPSPPTPQRAKDIVIEQQQPVEEKSKKRISAEGWLTTYEAELHAAAADGADAYMAVQARHKKALDKAAKEHPDLYERAVALGIELAPGPEPEEEGARVNWRVEDNDDEPQMTLARAQGIIDLADLVSDVRNRLAELLPQLDESDAAELELYANLRIEAMRQADR